MNRPGRKAGAAAPAPARKAVAAPSSSAAAEAAKGKRGASKASVAAGSVTAIAAVPMAMACAHGNENSENDEEGGLVTEEDERAQRTVDVAYNPELIASILADLEKQVQIKCLQIQKDADFMATSIRQAFHLELIKLPTQVKQMSLARFRSEFGDSLDAVTRGAIGGRRGSAAAVGEAASSSSGAPPGSAVKSSRASTRGGAAAGGGGVFQTPSHHRGGKEPRMSVAQTPSSRKPREGEMLLSANGSPLGEFQTVVKAARPGPKPLEVPATPGLFVPLQTGEIMDMGNADIAGMSQDVKLDALAKMQEMMSNMQALMEKLKN